MPATPSTKELEHSRAVREMFSGIAPRYDLLNHLLSANIDKRWRRAVSEQMQDILDRPEAVIADIACGTGDLSIELQTHGKAKVIGCDFCRPMLEIASQKNRDLGLSIPYIEGDAMSLPFENESFEGLTIAFGLRNLPNFENGLRELHRILKPGGRLAILEFSSPVVPGFRGLFRFYFERILPRIGGVVSGSRGAYEYLPDSVSKFPDQNALTDLMRAVGFVSVKYTNLTAGIAALHAGEKN